MQKVDSGKLESGSRPSLVEVLRGIFFAFPEGTPPMVVAKNPDYPDGIDLTAHFRDLSWLKVSAQLVALHKDDHLHFRFSALMYYLPAFMIQSLLEPELTDVAVDSTCFFMSPEVLLRNFDGLDVASGLAAMSFDQRGAMVLFLRYVQAIDPSADAGSAIEFWGLSTAT